MVWSRLTRQRRGYDKTYLKARPIVLKRDGYLCQCDQCKASGRLRPATEVDHVIPVADFRSGKATGDPHALTNLRAVNSECHKLIGLAQRGYQPRPRRRYDRNGRRR